MDVRVSQSFCTNDKAGIILAILPLYEHARINKELFGKALLQRNCEFNEEGYVRWNYFLISKDRKKISKKEEHMLENLDILQKCKNFMDGIEKENVEFCIDITAYTDGFQLNLDAKAASEEDYGKEVVLDSICYFIWKAF